MTNKSGDKGTKAETAYVNYLILNGWPHAERRRQKGGKDQGDTTGHPGLVFEVKDDKSLAFPKWLRDTETERGNAFAQYGILIHKPAGFGAKNVGLWTAMMHEETFGDLLSSVAWNLATDFAFSPLTQKARMRPLLKEMSEASFQLNVVRIQTNKNLPNYMGMYVHQMITVLRTAGFGQPL